MASFQTYNPAAGQGTFLHLAPGQAATTSFIAYGGGALVYSALADGGYSDIFAPGVSVATVQAQSYFA